MIIYQEIIKMEENENEKNKKNDKKFHNIYIINNINILYNVKRARHNRDI